MKNLFRVTAMCVAIITVALVIPARTQLKCKSGKPACGYTTGSLGKPVPNCCSATQACDQVAQECIDKSIAGHIFPAYVVLTILYAPPGNKSTVTYGSSSTTGSSLDMSSSLKDSDNWGFSRGASAKLNDVVSIGGSGTGSSGFSTQSDNSKTVNITKKSTVSLQLQSYEDALNHDHDTFIIWVNPDVGVTKDIDSSALSGTLGPRSGQPMRWVAVSASQLEGKEPMDKVRQAMLMRLKPSDYQAILSLDPALSGTLASANKERYDLVGTTVQVSGPANPGDPASSTTLNLSTDNNHSDASATTTVSTDSSDVSLSIVDAFKSSSSFTWTEKTLSTKTGGQGETANAVFGSSTQGEDAVYDVYYDKIYKTFAFEVDPMSAPRPPRPRVIHPAVFRAFRSVRPRQ